MRLSNVIALSLALAATPAIAITPARPAPTIAAAVADTGKRTVDNVKLDESRKPAEILQFFGLKPGMQVLDVFGANKYWSEIMAPVVGPTGHVTVWEPTQFLTDKNRGPFEEFSARQKNVSLIASPFEAPDLPKSRFDFAIINLDAWLKRLYAAMKPGGTVGVVDHVANANADTRATVDRLHRIDPDVIKADFKRAGFVLTGTSDLLRNPADDHTLLVFDPKIRGKTDRVVYKFKKPR
jgi:predicted methyltransferase